MQLDIPTFANKNFVTRSFGRRCESKESISSLYQESVQYYGPGLTNILVTDGQGFKCATGVDRTPYHRGCDRSDLRHDAGLTYLWGFLRSSLQ